MVDKEKIKKAVILILEAIGDDPNREGLFETPNRVANMYDKIFNGYEENPEKHIKTFNMQTKNMVIVKDIPFYSYCEHHLLPFFGKVHIGYIPHGKVIGLSKIVRMMRVFAKRPQIQERLTEQVADILEKYLGPDIIVYFEAEHMCMAMRGVRAPGTLTVTADVRGKFLNPPENKNPKEEFLFAIGKYK
jgi:GTP cyclohydrolase I